MTPSWIMSAAAESLANPGPTIYTSAKESVIPRVHTLYNLNMKVLYLSFEYKPNAIISQRVYRRSPREPRQGRGQRGQSKGLKGVMMKGVIIKGVIIKGVIIKGVMMKGVMMEMMEMMEMRECKTYVVSKRQSLKNHRASHKTQDTRQERVGLPYK
jgi:hypothetical protein